jgi:hypothetical protein
MSLQDYRLTAKALQNKRIAELEQALDEARGRAELEYARRLIAEGQLKFRKRVDEE